MITQIIQIMGFKGPVLFSLRIGKYVSLTGHKKCTDPVNASSPSCSSAKGIIENSTFRYFVSEINVGGCVAVQMPTVSAAGGTFSNYFLDFFRAVKYSITSSWI